MIVANDVAGNRFVVYRPEGIGQLVYRRVGPHLVDLKHTEVAPELRGQGIAEALAEAAFKHARDVGDQVIPTCPFVQKWLARHPEQMDIVLPLPTR